MKSEEPFRFTVIEEILDGENVIYVRPENPEKHHIPEPGDQVIFPDEKDDLILIRDVESFHDNDNYDITLEEELNFSTGEDTTILIKPRKKE